MPSLALWLMSLLGHSGTGTWHRQGGGWAVAGWWLDRTHEAPWPKCVEICSLKGASRRPELIQPSTGSGEQAGLVWKAGSQGAIQG